MLWPLIVAGAVMALAYILYRMLPEVIDFEMSFLWIAGLFLLIYIGAAYYLSRSLPSLDSKIAQATNTSNTSIQISDVISK